MRARTTPLRRIRWWCAAALLAVVSGCSTVRTSRYHGVSTLAVADVGIETGRILVRPNEVHWRVGEHVSLQGTIPQAEVGGFSPSGAVFTRDGLSAMPAPVGIVATREAIGQGIDGLIVTHWLHDTSMSGDRLIHTVEVWGRRLELVDLGPMDEARTDARRLKGRVPVGRPQRAPSPASSAAPPAQRQEAPASDRKGASSSNRPRRGPVPGEPKLRENRFGFDVGFRFGFRGEFASKASNKGLDATVLSVYWSPMTFVVVDFFQPVATGASMSVAWRMVPGSLVKPLVGVGVGGFGPTPAGTSGGVLAFLTAGIDIDPKGVFDLVMGFDLGTGIAFPDGAGFLFAPNLSAGFTF